MKITLECDHCTDHFTIIDDPIEFGENWYPDLPRGWETAWWTNGRQLLLCPVGFAALKHHRAEEELEASRRLLPHHGRDLKPAPWDG